MKLTVFGASGPVGREVVHQALEAGHEVVAVTRNPEGFPISAPKLRVFGGDVHEADDVRSAIDGADAVISALGVPYSVRTISTYSVGIGGLLEAMREQGVQRIVCVSSKELADGHPPGENRLYRFLFARLLALAGRTLYADMRRMEDLLRASDRRWTIARPAGLFEAERVTRYRVTAGHEPGVFTSTADLADALIRQASGDRPQHVGETIEILTDEGTPSYLGLVAKQALNLG